MIKGIFLAIVLLGATVMLVVIGTIWPVSTAIAYAGGERLMRSSATPEEAARSLGDDLRMREWGRAYGSLANRAQFTRQQFMQDVMGYYPNIRTYSTLQSFEVAPLHATSDEAVVQLKLHWSTVVGIATTTRDLPLVKNGSEWQVNWPIEKRPDLPPQVIPVNYLRWDVIYRGAGDDWGVQDVEAPHVRIVDMHPVQRAEGLVILGELLNEDVVPAYVNVKATLLGKNQNSFATEGSFDKISHILLPKQVTPFLITFPGIDISQVSSVRMTPLSSLIAASADPVIDIDNQHLSPAPDASLSGQLINESGETVNVAHVLGTFYDKSGQVLWVADQYVDRALLPQTPVAFNIHIPEDLARKVSSERAVVASYKFGGEL